MRGRRQHLLLRALARPAAHRRAGHLPARGAPTRRRRRHRRRLGRRRRRRRHGQARAALVLGSRRAALAQGRLLVLRAVPCTRHGAAAPGCRSMWPSRLGMSWQPALPCSPTVTASSKGGRCGAAARRGSGTAAGWPPHSGCLRCIAPRPLGVIGAQAHAGQQRLLVQRRSARQTRSVHKEVHLSAPQHCPTAGPARAGARAGRSRSCRARCWRAACRRGARSRACRGGAARAPPRARMLHRAGPSGARRRLLQALSTWAPLCGRGRAAGRQMASAGMHQGCIMHGSCGSLRACSACPGLRAAGNAPVCGWHAAPASPAAPCSACSGAPTRRRRAQDAVRPVRARGRVQRRQLRVCARRERPARAPARPRVRDRAAPAPSHFGAEALRSRLA